MSSSTFSSTHKVYLATGDVYEVLLVHNFKVVGFAQVFLATAAFNTVINEMHRLPNTSVVL